MVTEIMGTGEAATVLSNDQQNEFAPGFGVGHPQFCREGAAETKVTA
jgi:hypothetical protein